jgi:hypothetical protein
MTMEEKEREAERLFVLFELVESLSHGVLDIKETICFGPVMNSC